MIVKYKKKAIIISCCIYLLFVTCIFSYLFYTYLYINITDAARHISDGIRFSDFFIFSQSTKIHRSYFGDPVKWVSVDHRACSSFSLDASWIYIELTQDVNGPPTDLCV